MMVKCNFSFVIKGLGRWAIRSFHIVPYFYIKVNGELDVEL